MHTVAEVLTFKGSDVWSVPPEASVREALEIMAQRDIGALLVMKDDKLCGIFSERDYARKVVLAGKASKDTPVSEVLTAKVLWVPPERTVEECMALMTDKHIRHLPVLEGERVVGMLSIGDVVRSLIWQQQFIIGELERYISGVPSSRRG
jgi:CBS domain-containing protein